MRRRVFLGLACAVTLPRQAAAQGMRHARLGYLSGGTKGDETNINTIDLLKLSLSQRGWRIGDTLEIQERWAGGDPAELPRLARELIAGKPDILVATGSTETKALQDATQTIPIIFLILGVDPVSLGFVKSIARPGGNITGFMQGPQSLSGKRIELLTELVGRPLRRLAWLGNSGNIGSEANWVDARNAAVGSGSGLIRVNITSADEVERAFDSLKDCDAILVEYDFMLFSVRHQVARLAARQRLPAVYGNRVQVLAGGLMSFGGDLRENYRQGALYVDRVLNGTPVGDLPVVQASQFEFVINLKTAQSLGLTIPPTLLARANEVIE